MATPISEVIARNTEVLEGVQAFIAKAEEAPVTPTEEEEKGEEETTTEEEEKKDVTRDEFDGLMNRVAELEKKMQDKDEQNAKLMQAVEASTQTLNAVKGYFKSPSNRAIFAEGEAVKAKTEAVDPVQQKSAYEVWDSMPPGKAREAYFKAHEAEIIEHLK